MAGGDAIMATPTAWQPVVSRIVDGTPVSAGITNQPVDALATRTEYLKEVVDSAFIGTALISHNQPLDSTTAVGMAVYLDGNGVWQPALAAVAYDTNGIPVGLAQEALCTGLVLSKDTATLGNIVLHGEVTFDSSLLSVVAGGVVSAGLYYLSALAPGFLTNSRPAVGVLCASISGQDAAGDYVVFVMPSPRNVLDDHIHYKVSIAALPAGTPNTPPSDISLGTWDSNAQAYDLVSPSTPGFVHTITAPNSSVEGWLPVSSSAFTGMVIPAGAVFGYNIQQDAALRSVWPPVPPGNVYIEVNGRGASPELVQVNEFGIWWMANGLGKAPWAVDYTGTSSSSSSSSGSPLNFAKRIDVWFTKMVFKTASNMVTSLAPADATVSVTCANNGLPATTGALKIGVNLQFSSSSDDLSYTSLKDFNPTNLAFTHGHTVSQVRSISPSITVSGAVGPDTNGYCQGPITLQFVDQTIDREGVVQLVALDNVIEQDVNNILYLDFPADRTSSIRGKISIGRADVVNYGTVNIYFWFLGLTTGTLPAFTFSYRVLPLPAGGSIDLSSLTESTPISLTLPAIITNNYVEVSTAIPEVGPASTIYFTLQRSAPDAYLGDVGLLQTRYTVTPVA